MQRRRLILGGAGVLGLGAVAAAAFGWVRRRQGPALPRRVAPLEAEAFTALYETPLAPPPGPLRVYHLGHSLVARDMPAMLAQMAGEGHGHESQLGWGVALREHYEPRLEIRGYESDNAHPRFRPAEDALASGDYDAFVMTEMVEIRDAIEWHASPAYVARWAARARAGRPDIRIYLYETWHQLDDAEGWLDRLDADLERYWVGTLLREAATEETGRPIYLIPAGQAMARVVRAAEAGEIEGIAGRDAFFSDMIHLSDLGAYVVALTHYATLYQRSPEGLPAALTRADGTPADAPSPAAAAALQRLVWEVVTAEPMTGLAPDLRG